MNTLRNQLSTQQVPSVFAAQEVRDARGYEVFSQGEMGAAHALAHQMFDSGRLQLGHRLLGEWLASHKGQGSDWVHLQFHMAVFELAAGDWHGAYGRFLSQVLPTAAATAEALTDAPALLWRLAISAPEPVALPWQPLRRTALACMQGDASPFVQLHQLLALAGAGDAENIHRWLRTRRPAGSKLNPVVERFALACVALANRDYPRADRLLQALLPDLPQIGGSHAQGQLFGQLAAWAGGKGRHPAPTESYRIAA